MTTPHRTRMTGPFGPDTMVVTGPAGAVSLEQHGAIKVVNFHSAKPFSDGDDPHECPYLDGVPCHYDADTLLGQPRDLIAALGVDEERTYRYLEDSYRSLPDGA